jgi:hypothetical protein
MNQRIPKSAHDVLGRQPAPQEHPSADLLNGFVEQGLSAAEKEQVTAHLAMCADCREVVFLAGGAAEAPEPAMLDQPLPAAPSRWSFWNWKWIVSAVAAVAIAAGVTLMREDAKYPRTTASSSTAVNAPTAAPSPHVNEELADKDAATSRDAVKESKPAAQPEQELAKKAEPAGQKQTLDAKSQPSGAAKLESVPNRDSTAVGASLPDSFYSAPALKDAEKPKAPAVAGQLSEPANEAKDRGLMTKPSSSGKRDLEASSSLATPSSAADSSAKVLHKSKAAASEVGGGPSETAAARQNQQAAQQQKMAVDSGAVGGSSPDASSLIEGKPVSVRFSDWRITGDGHLERGSSTGEWTRVLADQTGYIQTVAQVGSDVWAGADDGVLFHSSDAGDNWSKVRVSPDEHRPIVSIRFRTGSEGTVTTDLNTTWKTSDGGKTWSKQ